MTISEIIKSKRTAMGLSQEKLAEKVQVTRLTVISWEAGKFVPDGVNMARLEAALALLPGTLSRSVVENPPRAPRGAPRLCGASSKT